MATVQAALRPARRRPSVGALRWPKAKGHEPSLEASPTRVTSSRWFGVRLCDIDARAQASHDDLETQTGRVRDGNEDVAVTCSLPQTSAWSSSLQSISLLQTFDWRTEFHKACWKTVSMVSSRNVLPMVFPDTVCFFDPDVHPGVRGKLALTIDDAPCRDRDRKSSMIEDVLTLLQEFDAHATFFLCTDYVVGHEEGLVDALRRGHEVANHCPQDRSYEGDTEEAFETAFLRAEAVCEHLRAAGAMPAESHGASSAASTAAETDEAEAAPRSPEPFAEAATAPRWFRAPHARLSSCMKRVLNRHGFTHVLTDCYANDPWISDATFLARSMLDQARDGSVAVLHMPERGFREYNFEAMRGFLQGLRDRQIDVVTLSALYAETAGPKLLAPTLAPKTTLSL